MVILIVTGQCLLSRSSVNNPVYGPYLGYLGLKLCVLRYFSHIYFGLELKPLFDCASYGKNESHHTLL